MTMDTNYTTDFENCLCMNFQKECELDRYVDDNIYLQIVISLYIFMSMHVTFFYPFNKF